LFDFKRTKCLNGVCSTSLFPLIFSAVLQDPDDVNEQLGIDQSGQVAWCAGAAGAAPGEEARRCKRSFDLVFFDRLAYFVSIVMCFFVRVFAVASCIYLAFDCVKYRFFRFSAFV